MPAKTIDVCLVDGPNVLHGPLHPLAMAPEPLTAHAALDRVVDKAFDARRACGTTANAWRSCSAAAPR